MPGLARIRRARTPERRPPPLLPRLPGSLLFCPKPPPCQLEAHCLTTAPSAQISRLRGNPLRHYHPRRLPQLRLRPRRNCSDPSLAAKLTRKDVRTQRRFPERVDSGSEAVAKHRQAALRFGFGRLVLQNVPVLGETTVLDPDNIRGDPGK